MRAYFGSQQIQFSPLETRRLKALAKLCRVTFNTLIEAAWSILLSRYSGESEAVFGIILTGRPPTLEGVDSIVGMFLNSLPMRVTVKPEQPLHEWLHEIKARQVEMQQFEHSSLVQVQAWSEIPRGQPLFDSVVVRRDLSRSARWPIPATAGRKESAPEQGQEIDLPPEPADDAGDRRREGCRTQPDLRRATLRCTDDDAAHEADAHAAGRDARGSAATGGRTADPLGKERQMVLEEWNNTATDYPRGRCLHHLFEEQLPTASDKVAVRCKGVALTYDELNRHANALAHYLINLGARPGTLVGLCVERSLDMAAALLAILKTGAAYVPLDLSFPLDRLGFMLEDAQASLVVTEERMLEKLPGQSVRFVCIDRDRAAWQAESDDNPDVEVAQENLAYVLYTSGSTGQPKGVAIPHRVPVNRLHAEHDPFLPDEALAAKTTLGFVDSIWELFSAWFNRLAVTLIPQADVKDPKLLVDGLAEAAGATRIVLVPSLLQAIFESDIDLAARVPRLKHWISSGEPLSADLCREFHQKLPGAVLTNLYGTTEVWDAPLRFARAPNGGQSPLRRTRHAGSTSSTSKCGRAQSASPASYTSVARAWPRVLEPTGTDGREIGSRSLRRGRDRTDSTAAATACAGWRTATSSILAVFDQQFKFRGFRIEPGEIEGVLRQHRTVRQAAVGRSWTGPVGRIHRSARRRIRADRTWRIRCQAPAGGHAADVLRPARKAAAHTQWQDRPAGSARSRGPAVRNKRGQHPVAGTGERTREDHRKNLGETLNVRSLGAHDNFFDLGGHAQRRARDGAADQAARAGCVVARDVRGAYDRQPRRIDRDWQGAPADSRTGSQRRLWQGRPDDLQPAASLVHRPAQPRHRVLHDPEHDAAPWRTRPRCGQKRIP